jgi:putative phosphoesterase
MYFTRKQISLQKPFLLSYSPFLICFFEFKWYNNKVGRCIMKIVVASDSHRDTEILDKIASLTNADVYLHAGDSALPAELIRPFISVRGNCDSYPYEISRFIECGDLKIYITHGHLFSKKRIVKNAKANGCHIAIFGHTHVPEIEEVEGIYLINPGSVSFPRGSKVKTYIEINYHDLSDLNIKIVEIKGEL